MYFTSYREYNPCIKLHVYIPRRHTIRIRHHANLSLSRHNDTRGDMMYILLVCQVLMVAHSYIYLCIVSNIALNSAVSNVHKKNLVNFVFL